MSRWRARVAELATAALVAGAIGVGVAAPAHALTRAPLVPVPGLAGLWFEGMISQVDSSQRLVVAGVEMDRTHGYTSACSGSTALGNLLDGKRPALLVRESVDGSSLSG